MRRLAWPLIGHFAILMAAVVPGAMATSVRTVYLVTTANVDPVLVGIFNYSASCLGIIILYFASRGRLDRADPIRLTIWTSASAVVSVFCILEASNSAIFLGIAAILSAIAQLGGSSIFLYDELYGPRAEANAGLYRTRLVLSLAWIVGPPLSFLIYWGAGFAAVAIAVTILLAASSLAMAVIGTKRAPLPRLQAEAKRPGKSTISLGFWSIFVIMVATTCANVLHSINLPLFLIEDIRVAEFWPGFIMSGAATVEVLLISLLPLLTRYSSEETVLWTGLALGIFYFALLPFLNDPFLILIAQVLYGGHFAATTVVCLPLLRRALTGGTGSLAAQFNNAGRIGGLLASALFAILVSYVGYQGMLTVACQCLLLFALVLGLLGRLTSRFGQTEP